MLTIESLFSSSGFLGQLRAIVHMSSSHDKSASAERGQPARSNQEMRRRPCRRRITRPEPGSLYDIMHDHAGASLYVVPICWTDLHSQLLGVNFVERPAITTPVPDLAAGRWLEPSKMAQNLTSELHTLVRKEASPARAFCKNRAIKHIMSTFFPATLSRPKTGAELNLYFGQRVFKKVVRIPCLWKSPSGADISFDSCPTLPPTSFSQVPPGACDAGTEYAQNMPMLAYISRSQLAAIRKNLYGVVRGPANTPNEPVARLQRLRSKMLIPANVEHDPYIVAILLAMAQAHFYRDSSSRSSSQSQGGVRNTIRMPPPSFRDIKVQVITHDEGNESTPNFVVYTAVVTATFLNRFMFPHKAPASQEDKDVAMGMDISYTPVSFWPILGLKERLAKALGREIAGDPMYGDPDHIGLWDSLLEPQHPPAYPTVTLKRRRTDRGPLAEVLNSSFEEEPPSSPDDRPVLSPAAKRRRTTRPVNPLEVC
ncbi:HNH nuclease domain-containing protein [Madurella fahalii]|uniref:HNH nuclease domain-containing protein n=1 Tax=Madurella fahalii TaxID=1157608 RepID=A0ABQ0GKJ0_9PEZI